MPETLDLITAVYAKTDAGLQEIQSRSLGLPPLVRRILVLVDGKKSGGELAAFLAGNGNIEEVLTQLLAQGCVEAQARKPAAAPAPAPAAHAAPSAQEAASADVPGLPPAESRTAKDNEMARNFMINSVNSIIGQNTRISLVNDIFNAQTTEQLRTVYHAWATSMSGHGMGAKRLPELREKLFKVL